MKAKKLLINTLLYILLTAMAAVLCSCTVNVPAVNETPSAGETPVVEIDPTAGQTDHTPQTSGLPTVYITTSTGKDISSKEEYVEAIISVDHMLDQYDLSELTCKLKGHGNTTWRDFGKIKPSYRLKLSEKENLAGIAGAAGKDYVLIANYADLTMLRNYVALSIGKKLTNIEFVPDFRFVNLTVNGKDRGLYLLCTKVKVAESRINIESDSTGKETDTGYLIELDSRASQDDDPYFKIKGTNYSFSVKSDTTSDAQVEYIKNAVTALYEACKTGDRVEVGKLADIDSIVDMFILEEFVKDRDMGFASFYMVKQKGGKIEFCSPWDFDLALGNDQDNPDPDGLITEIKRAFETHPNPFFVFLWEQQWFRDLVNERFAEVKDVIASVIEDYRFMADLLRESNDRNNAIYNVYGKKLFKEPRNFYKELKTYDEHVEFLYNWMKERLEWMEGYFREKAS